MDHILGLLKTANVKTLLQVHTFVIDELRERKIVRSSNSPLGDYAEHIFEKAFHWKLENNAASGHDAVDANGLRYQIKGRRITAHKSIAPAQFPSPSPRKEI